MAEPLTVQLVLARCESGVRNAFEKRYGREGMIYEKARELVWLEREIMEHVAAEFSPERAEPDCESYRDNAVTVERDYPRRMTI
jgi:hypothetical protein